MEQLAGNVKYILLVDDDPDDLFFLRRELGKQMPQAIIESFADGSEVLAYLDKCSILPTFIFLDLNMLKLPGRETLKVIRRREELAKIPVAILSTSRNDREKSELLQMGAVAVYSKPGRVADLAGIVDEVIKKWIL